MYNADIKTRFINEFSTSEARKKAATVMFNTIGRYEKEFGADICTASVEDVKTVMQNIVGFRQYSDSLRLSILNEYIRWCINNKIPGANADIIGIEVDLDEKFKTQTVSGPVHLQKYLDSIFEKESEDTVDCTYRCMCWMAFGGVEDKYMMSITASDVIFDEMVVRYNGYDYPIYNESLASFRKCATLTSFKYNHPNTNEVYRIRVGGNSLLRGLSLTNDGLERNRSLEFMRDTLSFKQREKKYRYRFDKNDKSVDLKLSIYRIRTSGIFYRMYEAERAGMQPDFIDVATKRVLDNLDKYKNRDKTSLNMNIIKTAKGYLKDYQKWKQIYSV